MTNLNLPRLTADQYRILFIGDVVGRPGRQALERYLPELKEATQPLFLIVNGENSAHGVGITPDTADFIFKQGADAITLGNHAFRKREILSYLESNRPIVRPLNVPRGTPGRGSTTLQKDGIALIIANLCGRVYMDAYNDPFEAFDQLIADSGESHLFIDFHAEATSEKLAFGYHAAGKATAVLGTHTHVTTADAQVLPGGTAYITDVGMTGPIQSILGMERSIILQRFRTALPAKFEVADERGVICAVSVDVQRNTGHAVGIRSHRVPDTFE